jgi:hypothetical protein
MKTIFVLIQTLGLLLTTMNAVSQVVPTPEEFAAATPEKANQILDAAGLPPIRCIYHNKAHKI